MFRDVDWSRPEDVERDRRSVAMLSPGAWALRREVALVVLGAVVEAAKERDRAARAADG